MEPQNSKAYGAWKPELDFGLSSSRKPPRVRESSWGSRPVSKLVAIMIVVVMMMTITIVVVIMFAAIDVRLQRFPLWL